MRRPGWIARQSARPTGPLGWLIAQIMARETAAVNGLLVERLGLVPGDDVLEIGYGHGRTLARIAAAVAPGAVAGVDHSPVMQRIASRRNRRAVRRGRVDPRVGDSASLPFPDDNFDKVLAVHTIYFWRYPQADLRECQRVLRPGGRLLLGYRPADQDDGTFPAAVYRFYAGAEVTGLLIAAGFAAARIGRCSTAHGDVEYALATAAARPRQPIDEGAA